MNVVAGYTHIERDGVAVERAVDECRLRDGTLHLVAHVDIAGGLNPQSVNAAMRGAEQLREELNALAGRLREDGVVCIPHFVQDADRHPADVLLEVADEVRAELIVVAVRHRTKVGKVFLGSTAQEILLRSPVPVLAVKSG